MGACGFHRGADLAFDQRAEEQREELGAEQGLDAGGVAQQHWGGVLHGLEQVVTPFEVGLVAVGAQHLGVAQGGVVGDQWVMPNSA